MHLTGHPIAHAETGAEADAGADHRAGSARGVRRRGRQRLAGLVLHVVHAQDAHRGASVDRLLDLVREVDRKPLKLLQLDPKRTEVLRRVAEHGLLDRVELHREVGDLHSLVLELPEGVVDEQDHLVAEARLDVRRGRRSERPDELRDEVVRGADVPTEGAEDA